MVNPSGQPWSLVLSKGKVMQLIRDTTKTSIKLGGEVVA
jgi:hypothetical protein